MAVIGNDCEKLGSGGSKTEEEERIDVERRQQKKAEERDAVISKVKKAEAEAAAATAAPGGGGDGKKTHRFMRRKSAPSPIILKNKAEKSGKPRPSLDRPMMDKKSQRHEEPEIAGTDKVPAVAGAANKQSVSSSSSSSDTEKNARTMARWGTFFVQFSPRQKNYYLVNMTRQFLEAFLLNLLADSPGAWQAGSVFVVEMAALAHVSVAAPYVLLAQSRAEIFTAVRCFLGRLFMRLSMETLSAPLMRDSKLIHFFFSFCLVTVWESSDVRRRACPAAGPYVGGGRGALCGLPAFLYGRPVHLHAALAAPRRRDEESGEDRLGALCSIGGRRPRQPEKEGEETGGGAGEG